MSVIYDRFPNMAAAMAFVVNAKEQHDVECVLYTDAEQAADAAVFPFQLTAPVVLVRRQDEEVERALERLAEECGGREAGT